MGLLVPTSSRTEASDTRFTGHWLVLATVPDRESAAAEAERAAHLLDRGLQTGGLPGPTPDSRSWDDTISVHETEGGRFEIIGGAGSEAHLRADLPKVLEHFPTARVEPSTDVHNGYHQFFARRSVVIAGSYRAHQAALEAARRLAAGSGLTFETRGLVYDERHGLIWPPTGDGPDSGRYIPRRFDQCGVLERPCVSVERSDGYPGFEPGYYIVVAGLMKRSAGSERRLAAVRAIVPDAYIKETNLWMGCVH